jgi:hypothetical protein
MLMATQSDRHHFQSAADNTRPFQKQSYGTSNSDRPLSDLINCSAKMHRTTVRPTSDIVQAADIYRHSLSPEGSSLSFYERKKASEVAVMFGRKERGTSATAAIRAGE